MGGCLAYLVGDCVEEGSLIGGLEVLDGVVVLEHAMGRYGPGGYAGTMVSWNDLW